MTVQNLSAQPPFITKDGSTIRSIETLRFPSSFAATHRGFAFYVADPISSILERTEMRGMREELIRTLQAPAEVRVSRSDPAVRLFYEF